MSTVGSTSRSRIASAVAAARRATLLPILTRRGILSPAAGSDEVYEVGSVAPQLTRHMGDKDRLSGSCIDMPSVPKGRHVVIPPPVTATPPQVHVYANAAISGRAPFAFGLTKDNEVVADTLDYGDGLYRYRVSIEKFAGSGNPVPWLLRGSARWRRRPGKHVELGCLLTSGWTHYGHWLPEHLLKLRYLEECKAVADEDVVLIVEDNIPSWKVEILERLGYGKRLHRWDGGLLEVDRLLVPSYPQPRYGDLAWMRRRLFEAYDLPDERGPTASRLYLSRQKQSRRYIVNHESVVSVLKRHGFTLCEPENMSFRQQMESFRDAEVVVGVHGSAFANVIFASESSIIEMFGRRVAFGFLRLSIAMGHSYTPLFGRAEVTEDGRDDSGIEVDVADLERALVATSSSSELEGGA